MKTFACTTATFGGSFHDKVEAMRGAGFTATELWAHDLFEHLEGPEVALRTLEDAGVRVSALQAIRNVEGCFGPERTRKLDIACRVMDLACLAGSPLVTLAANAQPSASGDFDQLVEDLAVLAGLASQRALRIAYEPIAWAPHVNTWRHALRLIEAVDHAALGLQLDVFHAFIHGDTRIALEAIAPERLFLVEISDFAPSRLGALDISRHYRLFPGEGTAPLSDFAASLQNHSYGGDLVVEIFNTAYRSLPAGPVAQRAWSSMQKLFHSPSDGQGAF